MSVLLLDRADGLVAQPVRWRDLALAAVLSPSLDAALARGRAPEESAALAVRAQRLTGPRLRRALADAYQRLLDEATGRRPPPPRVVEVQYAAIRDAQDDMAQLIACLRAPGPVAARGCALANRLITDGGGPLYFGRRADTLAASLREASLALAPTVDP